MATESKLFSPVRVILHCSATPDYPKSNKAFDLIGAPDIEHWHRLRKFNGIGYHKVIRQSGVTEKGRSLRIQGAHCYGQNHDSIGVCVVGSGKMNHQQVDALAILYKKLNNDFGITWKEWFGHYEYTDKKTCPNVPMELVRAYLRLL